jgi:hypothetical protein
MILFSFVLAFLYVFCLLYYCLFFIFRADSVIGRRLLGLTRK